MIAQRLTAQLLAGEPASDVVGVARHLLAVQAQDPRGARLAVRARTRGASVADVDAQLTDQRSLIVTWLGRGTLHLVCAQDYAWLQMLTTPPQLTSNTRRLRQEGVSDAQAQRGVAVIERALAEEGPLVRATLRARLDCAGVPTAGQALVHLLLLASLRGIIVRGPMVGSEQAFVLTHDWLEPCALPSREQALAELARRYLVGHGPADARDLAKWAGIALREARIGLSAIASELHQREDGLVELAGRPAPGPMPPARLLGAFDPLLLGWCSRAELLGEAGHGIVTSNGLFRPFLLIDGKAAGIWRLERGKVSLEPFWRLSDTHLEQLSLEAADIERFLGA